MRKTCLFVLGCLLITCSVLAGRGYAKPAATLIVGCFILGGALTKPAPKN